MLLHYFLILSTIYLSLAQQKKVVCYWNSDSDIHDGLRGNFKASDIDPTICTHIIYRNIWYTQGLILFWSPQNEDKTAEFLNLKARNPNVKLLIGVGGPSWGSTNPSVITSTPTGQDSLANKIKSFLDTYSGFDGCDIDWQWPGISGNQNDKANFAGFISSLRRVLSSQKILSISVAPRNEDIDRSYDIPNIIGQVDFINLNSFDLRGYISDTSTAFHSPYRKNQTDRNPGAEWNAISIVSSWRSRNVPTEKLTLGISTYGRSFTLLDPVDNGIDSAISGLGRTSAFSPQINEKRINIIPYSEICYNLKQDGTTWEGHWSSAHFAPYAVYDENQWVGYDDKLSVLAKIHLVIDNNLVGINYAALDYDDFSGYCNSIKFPLIKLGYDAIINDIFDPNPVETTTVSPRPGETTPSIITTEPEETSPTIITTEKTEITTITEEITTTEELITSEESTSTISVTETPSTITEPEISETTTQSETTSKTNKPSTISKTTTTRTTTSEIPTPPVTPDRSTFGASVITTEITRNSSFEDLTTTSQLTTITSSQSELSSSTTDFKTPPITPTKTEQTSTLSSSTSEGGSNKEETDMTDSSSDRSSTFGDESTNGVSEETTNGDGVPGFTDDDLSTVPGFTNDDTSTVPGFTNDDLSTVPGFTNDDLSTVPGLTDDNTSTVSEILTDESTKEIIDSTTLSSSITTDELDITTQNSSIITEESTTSTEPSPAGTEQSTTSEKSTTSIPSNFICPVADGNFKNPTDCTTFYICSNWYPYLFDCQPGLYFDEENNRCDYQSNVPCDVN